ncbi:divalent cation tolerance protein CutA [Roseibacterium sp. SDUM158017]|uniref:divalent-cation tolerance protein CutA n=1 Tax=Roseicyclus salinarum TaxID=3036773 RepID=UPI002415851A|nr:divalent cation tolerance protein CutA [Roseibacterium sp. SDUM158017]MDG4648261.1 divalent cation tolerance protein CutA [Roseibacterium sp. SDUM158017]
MIHVTTTCATLDDARALARAALEARLAACANVTPGIVSLFHWQGEVQEETEVALTFKTTEARRGALVALIARAHPYDLPVITWDEVAATPEAAGWCQDETGSAG